MIHRLARTYRRFVLRLDLISTSARNSDAMPVLANRMPIKPLTASEPEAPTLIIRSSQLFRVLWLWFIGLDSTQRRWSIMNATCTSARRISTVRLCLLLSHWDLPCSRVSFSLFSKTTRLIRFAEFYKFINRRLRNKLCSPWKWTRGTSLICVCADLMAKCGVSPIMSTGRAFSETRIRGCARDFMQNICWFENGRRHTQRPLF